MLPKKVNLNLGIGFVSHQQADCVREWLLNLESDLFGVKDCRFLTSARSLPTSKIPNTRKMEDIDTILILI